AEVVDWKRPNDPPPVSSPAKPTNGPISCRKRGRWTSPALRLGAGVCLVIGKTMSTVSSVIVPEGCLVAVQESKDAAPVAASGSTLAAAVASGGPACKAAMICERL